MKYTLHLEKPTPCVKGKKSSFDCHRIEETILSALKNFSKH